MENEDSIQAGGGAPALSEKFNKAGENWTLPLKLEGVRRQAAQFTRQPAPGAAVRTVRDRNQ